jgi:hypothetical protein
LKERGIAEQIAHHILDSMIDISNVQEDVVTSEFSNNFNQEYIFGRLLLTVNK